jgi:hypothetical protein
VRRKRGAAGGSGDQGRGGRRRAVGEVELLHEQVGTGVQEAGEGLAATEVEGDGGVVFVEAAQEVEDKGTVGDDLTQVPKGIGHALETPAVVGDRQIALDEVPELGVEVEGTRLTVPKKLGFDGEQGGT